MSWRDKLRPGSFRGVPFYTEAVENAIGRNQAVHVYPKRDRPYIEDMGKKPREFSVIGFIEGDDYMTQRDKLIKALETEGSGTLVHPYWGTQIVSVLEVRISESSDEGRVARFSIVFIEAGVSSAPDESVDTSKIVSTKSDNLAAAGVSNFAKLFKTAGVPEFVSTQAVSVVGDAIDAVIDAGGVTNALSKIKDNVAGNLSDPLSMATTIADSVATVTDITELKILAKYGKNLATISKTTPSRIVQSVNQQAVIDLIRTTAVSGMANQLAAL